MKAWDYLSGWKNFALPSNIQKRLYKFLLRRAIGQFLQTELDLDNFDIELVNGSVELRDLDLNLQTINELLVDTPFILEKGRVSSINASLPWANFWSGDISLNIHGLHLALRPVKNKPKKHEPQPTMEEDSPIMSSSLHFADDFLRTEIEQEQTQQLHESIQQSFPDLANEPVDVGTEGLQVLTRVIDKMLAKIKVEIIDTVICIIHTSAVPLAADHQDDTEREYALEIRVPKISYFDETPEFNQPAPSSSSPSNDARRMADSSVFLPPVANETIKIITAVAPTIWLKSTQKDIDSTSLFYSLPSKSETTIRSKRSIDDDLSETEFYEANEGSSTFFRQDLMQSSFMSGATTPRAYMRSSSTLHKPYEALLFTTMDKDNWVRLKLRPSIDSVFSIKQLDFLVTHVRTMLTPLQMAFIVDLLDSTVDTTKPPNITPVPMPAPMRPSASSTSSIYSSSPNILDDLDRLVTEPPRPKKESIPQPREMSIPGCKIKIQVSLVEFFLLYKDQHKIPNDEWADPTLQPEKEKDHIRFAVNHLIIRLQQFPQEDPKNKRRDSYSNTSNVLPVTSTIDVGISNIHFDEWILKPNMTPSASMYYGSSSSVFSDQTRCQTQYNKYTPIFEFDPTIKNAYPSDELFPSYGSSSKTWLPDKSEMVRIRLEKRQAHEFSRFVDATSYQEDINVDIQPFKLHVDPRIADRLENYVYAFHGLSKQKKKTDSVYEKREERSSGQTVYDDLDFQSHEYLQKRKIRIKCLFIRVLLYVPDMSLISTRGEFNDQFNRNQLSVDIKKVIGTWSSNDNNRKNSIDENDSGAAGHAYIDLSAQPTPTKINIELDYVNVFMKEANDELNRCWFTAKTLKGNKDQLFSDESQSPSIEVTIRGANTHSTQSARTGYFGAGSDIPQNLFEYLSHNENFKGEQKFHVPMEDQSESAMIFKQRTIETSLFVVNCHFPNTRMSLTKDVWDKVQIIQNDILLWQPRFLSKLDNDPEPTTSTDTNKSDYGRSSSILSQSHERLGQPDSIQTQSLFSIVAVMSTGTWDLHCTPTGTYRLQFSEFRYFAAIKHLCQDENITTLDIEELSLNDINRNVPLIYKTLPKTVTPKRNTPMVSLFSRLSMYPERNQQKKVTSIVACNICWKATKEIDFITDLVDFQKMPEEMVFIDPPTQFIKVYAHVLDTSIDYAPENSPTRAVIILDGIQVITDILAGQPIIDIRSFVQSIELYVVDDKRELDEKKAIEKLESRNSTTDSKKYWITMGLSCILAIQNIELKVNLKLDQHRVAPDLAITLPSTNIYMDTSTDAFQTLVNLITFAVNDSAPPPPVSKGKKPKRPSSYVIQMKQDMLSSIEENAFKNDLPSSSGSSYSKISPPTIEEDDEFDLGYVEEYFSGNAKKPTAKSSQNMTSSTRHRKHKKDLNDYITHTLDETEDFNVIEDYYSVEKKKIAKKTIVDVNRAKLSVCIRNLNFTWKLYDGYEWDYLRGDMAAYNHAIKQQTSQDRVQTGFGDIPVASETDFDPKRPKSSRRSKNANIEIKLKYVSVDLVMMPEKDVTAMWFNLLIRDIDIIDNIKTSKWKKFLGYMRPDASEKPRETNSSMVDLEDIMLRPVPGEPSQQEHRIKLKLLPLRSYVDQDALGFLVNFFTFDKSHLRSTAAANLSIPVSVAEDLEDEENNLFFQHVEIYPITLKVDYKAKHINYGNIKEGQLSELVNLFSLDSAEVNLSHVKMSGIKGFDKLMDRISEQWLPHIMNTQMPNMVSGVSPIRSIVNLSSGVADLVLLPVQQYKRDGRLIKGIQKGTQSFARATAIEAIKLGSRVASGTQFVLEHADGFFSTSQTSEPTSNEPKDDEHFVYTDIYGVDIPNDDDDDENLDNQMSESSADIRYHPAIMQHSNPSDITEGLQFAYQNLSKNLGSAAQSIFSVPASAIDKTSINYAESSSSGNKDATKAVMRAVPVAIIKPMIGITGAFQSILAGLRNSIDPVMRLQSEDKYKKQK